MKFCFNVVGVALALIMSAGSALALGANVTPGIIFGSGNANGGFKVETLGPLELGLRAKLRYDVNEQPQNIFPFDGIDTYTFDPADGNAPAGRAIWNFEWSIFTGLAGASEKVSDYSFDLVVEGPNGGTASINPTETFFGIDIHGKRGSFGGGTRNVHQGSQNVGFDLDAGFLFSGPDWPLSAAQSKGKFTFTLTASQHGSKVLSNTMHVNVVPVPAALPLLGGVFAALGLAGWRKRRLAAI